VAVDLDSFICRYRGAWENPTDACY
jgi:hypothetical protein